MQTLDPVGEKKVEGVQLLKGGTKNCEVIKNLSLVKCNLTKLTTTSLAFKWSISLVIKRFIILAV